jgi:hypothetical protein
LAKIRDAVAQDLVNCTASSLKPLKLEADDDAKTNLSTYDAQLVRVFRNLEDIDGFDEDDVLALGADDESHSKDQVKRQCWNTVCSIQMLPSTYFLTEFLLTE